MELRETIESINYKLEKEFGKAFNNRPNFRVVFSEDQIEKRFTTHTDTGVELLYPEVRELPKYRQWITQRYILERLIPIIGSTDLTSAVSYEPCWVFQDKNQNYLPPWFEGCRFVIESILIQTGQAGHVKYHDPLLTPETRREEITKVERELFGNETDVGDHLTYGTGVVVPDFNVDGKETKTETAVIETAKEKVN